MATTPQDFAPYRTRDGSFTLRSAQWGEQYHSLHGAVLESTHVYIQTGIAQVEKATIDVLEIGLGTGLNLLLTWVRCFEGKCNVRYTALEPEPLDRAMLEALDHCADLAWPGLHQPFLERMTATSDAWHEPMGGLTFRKHRTPVQLFAADAEFDVIYFDAFDPDKQPDMWTLDVFQRMYGVLRPGGILVTYCAKGEVRRTMRAAGFTVERLKGPPGKLEMMRATRPLSR
ncbi:MAG: tRNA (5-methylaminomethyl-2-thiouridine)(34)-methyltransferase MnmD [Flavobacteriales bacterium]